VARRSLAGLFSPPARIASAALAACAVLGLSACGGDGNAATVTSITIRPSSYEVKPPATPPSTAPAVPTPNAEGRSAAEQTYTIHEDEYPVEIAQLFDISLDELRNWNGWDADYANYPGTGGVARIPPNAKFIDPNATTTTVAGTETSESEAPSSTAAAGSCTPGTHELEEGDYPVDVARKYDITIEALLAANGFSMDGRGNVPAWPGPGGTVNIPAGDDCSGAATATTAAP
jgi:hypothetical protein